MTQLVLHDFQEATLPKARQKIAEGYRAILIVGPTGCGKTIIATAFALATVAKRKKAAIFTNRKILLDQATETFDEYNVNYGKMASGHKTAFLRDVQVCSFQTIDSRVFKRQSWTLPEADVVLIDEAHSNKGAVARQLIEHYLNAGAIVLGLTATPVGLAGLYHCIVQVATYSELQGRGLLVPCDVYAPSEPDMRGVKISKGDFAAGEMEQRVIQCTLFADVYREWERLNPFRLPTVLFAPGVKFSLGFVQGFKERGATAAHIDADTDLKEREDIFAASKEGDIQVISSCGVLREGWNAPWIRHGILAQPSTKLSTYIQAAGRLLRSFPGKERATLQDHAGAFWRHGPPDQDIDWKLDDTDQKKAEQRKERLLNGTEREPICCPKCGFVRSSGPQCPSCGHRHEQSTRKVRTLSGKLVHVTGEAFQQKKPKPADDQREWIKALARAVHANKTLSQARHIFKTQTGHWPGELSPMPEKGSIEWNRLARDVYPNFGRRKVTQ